MLYDGNEKLKEEEVRNKLEDGSKARIIIGVFPEELLDTLDIVILSPGVPADLQCGPAFFTAVGIRAGDGGRWLRKQCLILARNNCTPVSDWLSMPLSELRLWIGANNEIEAENAQRRREAAGGK